MYTSKIPVPGSGAKPSVGIRMRFRPMRWLAYDWRLTLGIFILSGIVLFWLIGRMFVTEADLKLGSAPFTAPPSAEYPFGTDSMGRDLFALVVFATPTTLKIGFIATAVATIVGTFLGLVTGYFGGSVDTVIRSISDIMITIPALLVLVAIAAYINATIQTLALVIAVFSWPFLLRPIRAQTLTLRERAFVRLSKLSNRSDLEIILFDLLPNLLPFIAAGAVSSVSGAILTAIGLQLLGIGPINEPTLGLILQNAFDAAAILRGLWWWWFPPIVILSLLFIGLFLVSLALDAIANPQLRGVKQ